MTNIKALGLCGSLRADSFNLKLLKNFLAELDAKGATTRLYGALDLPLVNQDLENAPLDRRILDLQAAIRDANVVVLGSPEYNASFSPVLKNAIDWATRPQGTNCWQDKIVVLLAASPGALGGARGLIQVRTVLSGLRAWVIPEQVQCGAAHQAFAASGKLTVEPVRKQIAGAVQGLETFAKRWLV
jgi:chromate reductase